MALNNRIVLRYCVQWYFAAFHAAIFSFFATLSAALSVMLRIFYHIFCVCVRHDIDDLYGVLCATSCHRDICNRSSWRLFLGYYFLPCWLSVSFCFDGWMVCLLAVPVVNNTLVANSKHLWVIQVINFTHIYLVSFSRLFLLAWSWDSCCCLDDGESSESFLFAP